MTGADGILQAPFWQMGGYAAYVWPSYGLALVVLLWLLWRAAGELRQAEKRLKQLQSVVAPAIEKDG